MRRSRTPLVILVVALLTLITAELGARRVAPYLPEVLEWDNEFTQVKARDIQRIGQVDVAFLGSSVVNAGYEAPILVDTVDWIEQGYNAALPSTTPRSWEPWVNDLVIPELCPSLLVIGVSAREYSDNTTGADERRFSYFVSEGRRRLYGERPAGEGVEEFFESELALVRIRSRLPRAVPDVPVPPNGDRSQLARAEVHRRRSLPELRCCPGGDRTTRTSSPRDDVELLHRWSRG